MKKKRKPKHYQIRGFVAKFLPSAHYLYWWIMFCIICLGSAALYVTGIFGKVNEADVTKLSYLIYAIFVFFTIRTGFYTYHVGKDMSPDYCSQKQEIAWFVAGNLLKLGMLGTILGFIYMLGISFSEIDPSNMIRMRVALKTMGVGISTALYTTAAGLICGLGLEIQLFNLQRQIEERKREKSS